MSESELIETDIIESIKKLNFCVFDLETTGGNLKSDKIIEIGLVKVQNLEVVERKDYLVQPEIRIPDFIQRLTNIRQEDVANAPVIEDIIDDLLDFMSDSILVAHNTSFDVPFFNSVLERLGKNRLENQSLCTNLMTKYLIPNLLNSNLNYMSKIFKIKHSKAHRALDDANATAELLINYLKIFIAKDIQKINHIYYPRNRYELDRIHFKQNKTSNHFVLEKLHQLKTPCLVTLKGENGVILLCYPLSDIIKEASFIKEMLENLNWETCTLKLYGTFLQGFMNFTTFYPKVNQSEKNKIINSLEKVHFKKSPVQKVIKDDDNYTPDTDDFIITRHLVPEQYIILPLQSLHPKNQLVFRYPSHKKKLLQFIKSKSSRITSNKLKKSSLAHPLQDFLDQYLLEKKDQNDIFLFKKDYPIKFENDFFKKLDQFLSENPAPYQYPREYI